MKTKAWKIILSLFIMIMIFVPKNGYSLQINNDTPTIDVNETASLNIDLKYKSTYPIAKLNLKVYKVGSVSKSGIFKLVDPFKNYPIKINGLESDEWRSLASTLEGYILRDNIEPLLEDTTGWEGNLEVSDLTTGLYLVIGDEKQEGAYTYTIEPFMISLPNLTTENKWTYDVLVEPKITREVDDNKLVDCSIIKVWEDEGYENKRPESIVVQLLKDGELFDEIELSRENNWIYTIENLDTSYNWQVVEQEVLGYTVLVSKEDDNFILTNTSIQMREDMKLPNTGQLWWPIPILLTLGAIMLIFGWILYCGDKKSDKKNN